MEQKKEALCICVCFLFALGILTALSIFKQQKSFSDIENRYLQTRPEFTWKDFFNGTFGEDYENYIADQFPVRDAWVTLKVYGEKARGMMDANGVFFGSDGYLFENDGFLLYEDPQAQKNTDDLNRFIDRYSGKMASMSVVFVPSSSAVLEQKLPALAPVYPQNLWIENAFNPESHKNRENNVHFINLYDSFSQYKNDYIYYRTDHHWTTYGAYLAYTMWAEEMGFTPLKENDFKIETAAVDFYGTLYSKVHAFAKADTIEMYIPKEDLSQSLIIDGSEKNETSIYDYSKLNTRDKYGLFLGGNYGLEIVKTAGDAPVVPGRKLLIIKDSFANCFVPFASLHFSETVVVDLRHMNMNLSSVIEKYGITDILVLYNIKNFAEDKNVYRFLK